MKLFYPSIPSISGNSEIVSYYGEVCRQRVVSDTLVQVPAVINETSETRGGQMETDSPRAFGSFLDRSGSWSQSGIMTGYWI